MIMLKRLIKTVTDTSHMDFKPKKLITKESVCGHDAVSKHIKEKFSGKKKCCRKRWTSNKQSSVDVYFCYIDLYDEGFIQFNYLFIFVC